VRQNRLEYHLQPEGFIVLQVQDLVVCYLIDFLIESAGSGVRIIPEEETGSLSRLTG
jgi:hypothetical protein